MANLWSIQVLTPDFLLDGKISTDMMNSDVPWTDPYLLGAYGHNHISDDIVDLVYLTETQCQPTGNLVATGDLGTDCVINANNSIAIIPRDEASTAYLVKKNKYKSLVSVDMVIGHYLVRGKVWSPDKPDAGLKCITKLLRFVMQDVIIESQLPGTKFHGLEAPCAVLYTFYFKYAALRA